MKLIKNKKQPLELVINLHLTEKCNFSCNYCYATWGKPLANKELHRQKGSIDELIKMLSLYFLSPNPILNKMKYNQVRINFAGGEPMMLGDKFTSAIKQAKKNGLRTSVITNGYYLTDDFLNSNSSLLDMIGISFDSVSTKTAQEIGRCSSKGNTVELDDLMRISKKYKSVNPSGKLKINTVVNSINVNECMNEAITAIAPDKWKVLRVLPVYKSIVPVVDKKYMDFLERHKNLANIQVAEDNVTLQLSYLMINPSGRFFQNKEIGNGYKLSEPILDVGVEEAIKSIDFDIDMFLDRY